MSNLLGSVSANAKSGWFYQCQVRILLAQSVAIPNPIGLIGVNAESDWFSQFQCRIVLVQPVPMLDLIVILCQCQINLNGSVGANDQSDWLNEFQCRIRLVRLVPMPTLIGSSGAQSECPNHYQCPI